MIKGLLDWLFWKVLENAPGYAVRVVERSPRGADVIRAEAPSAPAVVQGMSCADVRRIFGAHVAQSMCDAQRARWASEAPAAAAPEPLVEETRAVEPGDCGASYEELFRCGRPLGHAGDHVAFAFSGKELARWLRETPPAKTLEQPVARCAMPLLLDPSAHPRLRGLSCEAPRGHVGDHVAFTASGLDLARWPRNDSPPADPPDEETCPRCKRVDCSPECIAQDEAEVDAYEGPVPRKFA